MKISFDSRKEFAELASAAGTTLEKLLADASNNAVAEGEKATADIAHDETVIELAKVRIFRNKTVLQHATSVLKLVRKYVS